jgi:glycosyltransferase involved in cell wall biosynthesis
VDDVTVVVGTYGDRRAWESLAYRRAIPSARMQGVPVIHMHGDTLAQARNDGIRAASTEWVLVLDADDELAPGAVDALLGGSADLRAPRLIEVHPSGRQSERVLAERDIERLNPLPVTTLARRAAVLDVGGFQPWPAWEDWALWLTLVRRGATYEHIREAVLYAHIRPGSLNRSVRNGRVLYRQIREASW